MRNDGDCEGTGGDQSPRFPNKCQKGKRGGGTKGKKLCLKGGNGVGGGAKDDRTGGKKPGNEWQGRKDAQKGRESNKGKKPEIKHTKTKGVD